MKKLVMIILMMFVLVSCGNINNNKSSTNDTVIITSKEKSDLVYMGYEKVYENITRKYDMSYECETLVKIKYKNEGLFEYGICTVKYNVGMPSNDYERESSIKIKYYAASYEESGVSFLIKGNVILKEVLSVEFEITDVVK